MDMIRLEGVSKQFGSHEVIKSLNLRVPSQCVFGFLGQNGAGKTTTMKMILGLLNPSEDVFLSVMKKSCMVKRKQIASLAIYRMSQSIILI